MALDGLIETFEYITRSRKATQSCQLDTEYLTTEVRLVRASFIAQHEMCSVLLQFSQEVNFEIYVL